MKRLFLILLAIVAISSSTISAQDKKEERRARKEQRRAERAVLDSLRMAEVEEDSVNVGYGYTKRRKLTTSVSKVSVSTEDIGGYNDIGEYLQGRVPGLSVQRTGNGYRYIIRGLGSVNSPSDPLFVVNGTTVNDISYLNPRDIKSVEVLKDASASIYGTRGACGVILITTK